MSAAPPLPLSWCTGLSHWSPSDKESQTSCVFFFTFVFCFFVLPGQLKQLWQEAAAAFFFFFFFLKWRSKCFVEGKLICSKKKKKKKKIKERFRPLRSSQCGGFNQKSGLWPVLPETNSQRSLPRPKPSEEGGLCCELNRGHLSFFFFSFFSESFHHGKNC